MEEVEIHFIKRKSILDDREVVGGFTTSMPENTTKWYRNFLGKLIFFQVKMIIFK